MVVRGWWLVVRGWSSPGCDLGNTGEFHRLALNCDRKVAQLRQITLLLVERDDHIVGTIDERALAADHDATAVAAAMRPLATWLRPATPVTEARELFIRAGAAILPVITGGFILGGVTLGDVERARA